VPPEQKEDVKVALKGMMNGETDKYEYHENTVLTKSGEQRLIAWHNVVLWDENKKINAVLSSGEDITERKEAEEELAAKMEELEEFNRLAVGREQRMIELKEEINRLLAERGMELKYEIVR
jgi:PAS domain-containing protein